MNKLISVISIKSRIYLSFIFSSLLLLVISHVAYQGIVKTQDKFKELDLINSKSQQILKIDLSIANLKISVEDFSYTGYDAVAEKVNAEMVLLKLNLSNMRDTFLDDVKEKENLNRMVKHLDKYQEIFVLVVEEISQRQKIIDDLYSIEAELLESAKLTDTLKIKLIRLKNILLEYLNDPDILKTNKAIEVLNEEIKVSSADLRKSLIEYKSNYIGVIQSTRGFLYLNSVVMPAEIQQLEYLSNQLTDLILSKNEPIKSNYRKVITETRDRIIIISVLLLILALLISYFISNSISRPLYKLTNTFKRLAKNEAISTIPGLELADEIGDMSKSAEIFRLKNEETERLLIELDNKNIDLENSENEIKQSLDFNSLIMNNIPDMVFVKDKEFKIIQANDAFLNTYPEDIRERVIGTTTLEKYNHEEAEKFLENDSRAFDEGYNETEETISFPDGQVRILFTKKVRFENIKGEKFILGVSQDITSRKEAEREKLSSAKEIEKTSNALKGILENAVDGIISIDKKGMILSVNPAAEKLFAYDAKEMVGQNVKMLMPSPYHEEHDGYLSHYHETGEKKIIGIGREVTGQRKDGSTFPMELTVSENKIGDSHSFTGIVRDITERIEHQRLIENQRNYYESLISNFNFPAFVIDNNHKVVVWNKACEILTGLNEENVIGTTEPWRGFYSEERPCLADLVLDNIHEKIPEFYEKHEDHSFLDDGKRTQNWCSMPNGKRLYLDIDAGPILDEKGNTVAVIEVLRDITNQVKAEKNIIEQKEYYENLFKYMNVPAFILDNEHKLTMWNKACEQLTGAKQSDLLGTDAYKKVIYKEDRLLLADMILDGDYKSELYPVEIEDNLMPGGKRVQDWVTFPLKNKTHYMNFDACPIYDAYGERTGVLELMLDITTIKNLEESIQENNIQLQRSNEELERFAYVASHDLQEPLRMVASYTNLLGSRYKDKLDDDANDFINYAMDGAKRMQALINDLLAFSRLNAVSEEFSVIDTDELVEGLLNVLDHSINEENNVVVTKEKLPKVKGREPMLRQLFQNLITNAVKYSDHDRKNEIHISAKNTGKMWTFSISDTGIGIAPEYYEKIFVIFKRLHGREEYSGTGIGLALCKKIVENHGGKIWLESIPDQGSTFMFTLFEE